MNILNILEGIEKLVVELLLWIIFVPKTLFKILADPEWVPGYVEKELAKESDRFDNYISPILLFLPASAVLFVIFNTLDPNAMMGAAKLPAGEKIIQLLQGDQGVLAGLGFLSLPLLFALATELLRGAGITRQGIRRALYIQCFYFSPLTLSVFAFLLFSELLPQEEFVIYFSALLFATVMPIWFLIVEVKLIKGELKSGLWKAIGVLLGCILAFIIGGTFLLLALDPEFRNLPLYTLGCIYVLIIIVPLVIGFRSLFRKPQETVKQSEEATN